MKVRKIVVVITAILTDTSTVVSEGVKKGKAEMVRVVVTEAIA